MPGVGWKEGLKRKVKLLVESEEEEECGLWVGKATQQEWRRGMDMCNGVNIQPPSSNSSQDPTDQPAAVIGSRCPFLLRLQIFFPNPNPTRRMTHFFSSFPLPSNDEASIFVAGKKAKLLCCLARNAASKIKTEEEKEVKTRNGMRKEYK
jgi:hypothetical protein